MSKPKEIRKKTHLVRLDLDGQLDELCASNVNIHLERMSGSSWWMGIGLANGENLSIRFAPKSPRSTLVLSLSEDGGDRYWAEGDGVDKP